MLAIHWLCVISSGLGGEAPGNKTDSTADMQNDVALLIIV
jgi:hypothetical protein